MADRPNTFQGMVGEFHEHAGHPVAARPSLEHHEACRDLRIRLLTEEFHEAVKALRDGDLAAIGHELADLVYVAIGTAVTYGLPFADIFTAVHAANMTRTRVVAGKSIKGPDHQPPDIAAVLGSTAEPDQGKPRPTRERRYATGRPSWLGEFQPWPCGRCGESVDDHEPHFCVDNPKCGNPHDCTCYHGCDIP